MNATVKDRSQLDDLKARVDLAELIRQSGVDLKKTGRNYLGRCPFHEGDREPSLSVNPDKNLWNCFACEAGGDALRFLQLKEKIDFPQAVERLKALARPEAAPPPEPDPSPDLLAGNFRRSDLLERVIDHYIRRFRETPTAQQYLNRRGLDSKELWEAFRIGYADGSFAEALPNHGQVKEALTQLGVLNAKGREAFRGCIVVPLSHPDQGLVGLYGRRLDPEAKVRHQYLPGPHRGILNWQALKLSPAIILTESVLDALSFWRAGLTEVTCLYGAQGLPQGVPELLERYGVREINFCLDNDRAGQEATEKLSRRFQEHGLRCQRITLTEGKDPNQILTERGGEALKEMASHRQGMPEEPADELAHYQATSDGFQLRFGDVTYQLWPQPPFTNRLRARLRVVRDHKMLMDQVDFYVSRSRKNALNQLCGQMEIPRIEAERHLLALLERMEEWVKSRKDREDEELDETTRPPVLSDRDKQEALEFLRRPDLVQRILQDMDELGYVGEENSKLLAYLVGLSRKLEKPFSAIIRSQSGAGKSAMAELVEMMAPPEDVVLFSRVTPQALYWMPRNAVQRKLLMIEERTGGEGADYSIRTLQTRAKLMQAVPIKDPVTGKIVTKTFIVEGPIAYIETTTDPKINYENATRCFEIVLDETPEQTRRIQAWQRGNRLPSQKDRRKARESICQRHHNAQRMLEPALVYIPYVELLSFPSRWLRTRRDNERFLCLIEAAAFLHQHQRENGRTDEGTRYIIANLDDYRLAYTLAKDILCYSLHELNRDAQDLLDVIREWLGKDGLLKARDHQFTRKDLRQVTGMEDYRLRQSLQELTDMEYLEALSGGQGRTYHYRLVAGEDTRPTSMRELTTPEELEQRWKGGRNG